MALREDQLWDMSAVNRGQRLHAHKHNHKQRLDKLNRMVAEWETRIALAQPRCRQVQHLIEKFGGILPFAVACNRHPNQIIYFWLGVSRARYVDKKRWGLVPSMGMLLRLVIVARSYGVLLTPEDLFPDMIDGTYMKNPYSNPELAAWALAIAPGGGNKDARESMLKLETEIAELVEG